MSLSQAATEFLTGRPAGVSAVSRSAGLLTSWVENGFNCSVQRDPAGLPYMLVAERAGRGIRLTQSFTYSGGVLVGMTGDTIPTVFRAEVMGGQAPVSGGGNTVALLGDSRVRGGSVAAQINQQTHTTALLAKLGRLKVIANFATGGKRTDEVLSAQVPLLAAMTQKPRYVMLETGYNDIAQGSPYRENLVANWGLLYSAITALGCTIIQNTTLPGAGISSLGSLSALARFNQYLMEQQSKRSNLIVWDAHGAAVDTATGLFLSSLAQVDGIHVQYQGAWALANYGYAQLDSRIPKAPMFGTAPNAHAQLCANPTGNSNTGTIAGGFTGVVPTLWTGTCAGAAACVGSKVARSDGRTGEVTRLTFSAGTTAADYARVGPTGNAIYSWSSGKAVALHDRVRPTIANGYQYQVTTAGSLASGSDPTASWSTSIGTTFTSGSATLLVTESIDIGDTVAGVCKIAAANFNSLPGTARLKLTFSDAAFAVIQNVYGNYADATYTLPTNAGGEQTLMTPEYAIPAGTVNIVMRVEIMAQAGAVIDVDAFSLHKSLTPEVIV